MRKYLVVFMDFPPLAPTASRAERFWTRLFELFLKPGFRHVFAICEEKPGRFLIIDPHWRGADVVSMDAHDSHPAFPDQTIGQWYFWLAHPCFGADWRSVFAAPQIRPNRPPLTLLSCVSIIHHLLGLRGFALTPWQLYRLINQQQEI